jgi:tetratricopeptide (TPR) repeat protein
MTTGSTDWVSAIAILASGLILGLMVMYFLGRRRAAAVAASSDVDLELRDLEAKRDALIAQIRELDDVSSKFGPTEAAEERTRLELETAAVLRAIDTYKRTPSQPREREITPGVVAAVPAPAPAPARASATVGFMWGAGSMLALGVLGYLLMQSMKPRPPEGGLTGGGPIESAPAQQGQPQPAVDPETKRLEAAVQQQPENIELRVELARAYLERENLMGVFDQTQYVLAKAPNEPRALTYQGLVRLAMGQGPEAAEMLDKATKIDPKLLDAWVALAWVRTQANDTAGAEKAIGEAMRQHPEEKQRLEEVFTQMKNRPAAAAQPPVQTAEGGELPPGHPPITPSSPKVGPVPTTAPSTQGVRITVDSTSSARSGTLFVFARAAGVAAGPPIAVRRMTVASLPVTIDLTAADSMMGQKLPQNLRVEARLDSDGNVATRNPTDPKAVLDGVAMGSAIRLALQ